MNRFMSKSSELCFISSCFLFLCLLAIWRRMEFSWGFFSGVIGSVDDFAVEGGPGNYSGQYKDLEKLVKNLDTEIMSKFDGSSRSSSSAGPTPTRYLV